MSEAAAPTTKRIALTTLASTAPAKKDKDKPAGPPPPNADSTPTTKGTKSGAGHPKNGVANAAAVKTQRFDLKLHDSTEESCPEFNFADLLSCIVTSQKKDAGTPHQNGSTPAGLDPFASDDEDQLRNIAKKFEEKYGGPVGKKKKSKKYDDYVDLGAGYDETDPFIDNTDAYDEIVPAELTTAHGGFYINSGALEFKPVEENADGSDSGDSDESESSSSNDSESEDSDSEPSAPRKRRVNPIDAENE